MKSNLKIAAFCALTLAASLASAQTIVQKMGNAIKATDNNVKCDNVTDDTAAINALLINKPGLLIEFPSGICRYSGGGVLKDGTVLVGAGRHATTIKAIGSGARLFNAFGYGAGIRSMKFDAAVPQTGGTYVVLQGQESFIEDFHMTHDYNGILMIGSVSRVRHGQFQDGAPGAIRIRSEGGDNSQLIDDVLMGGQDPQVTAGIRVRNSSALIISNTSVIQQGIGLLIDPYTDTSSTATDAGNVFSLYVHHCFFDNSSQNGIRISPTGWGSVQRSRFDNVWAGSSKLDGVLINNTGSGSVEGIHFTSPHLLGNGGAGISTSGQVRDISINGGEIAGNSFGVYLNAGANGVRVSNALVGQGAGTAGNTNNGFVIENGVDYVILSGNDVRGNKGGSIVNNAVGTNQLFQTNFGITPIGPK